MLSKRLFLASVVLFVLVSFLFVGSVRASSEMWSQTYGGASSDSAEAMVQTSDGGYAIAGYTTSFGAGYADFWLVKTDEYGNMEWNRTYGGAGEDIARSLIVTSDGGYAIAGIDLLVKTDEYGNMEWNQTYGGYSLVETSDGGYALAGVTNIRICHSDADFWLIKTDAYGNMLWNKTYSKGVDCAHSVVETSDGGYALAGFTGFWFDNDIWVVKTDEYGNIEWNNVYGDGNSIAHSLVATSDGGYAIAGDTDHAGAGGYDFWLIKTDADGSMIWNRTYGGAEDDIAHSLVVTSDGGFAIAGETSSFGAGDSDFWLVKTDEYGIPEFPSWAILPLLLLATLVTIFCKKRLPKNLSNQQKPFILGD